MELTPFSLQAQTAAAAEVLHDFEVTHREELATITDVLVKITHRSPDQIKPLLSVVLGQLAELPEQPFYETATPEERAQAFSDWAASHERGKPLLSDYAVSRESFYDDARLRRFC